MKRCPVCGSPVKVENLERHLKKVHPGEDIYIDLSKDEQKKTKAMKRRRVSRREGTVFAGIAIAITAIIILAFIYRPPSDGIEIPPPFETLDVISGATIRLPEDFYYEVVFLEFFSTDCAHCRDFVSTLNRLYDNYSSDVNFVSIDVKTDDTEQDIRDFIEETSSREWTYAIDISGDITKDYRVDSWPRSFIIDLRGSVQGEVAKVHRGYATYDVMKSELDEVLNQ
jgi:thiol-disulfide isomerase/thioredoxin